MDKRRSLFSQMMLLSVFAFTLTFVACNASSVTICATDIATITCHNDSAKIFIESVSYGRTDNVTCLAQGQAIPSCNTSIDLSWRVTPDCQGQSSCVVNGSYDGQEIPCDGDNTNYWNISYNCVIINETVFPENTVANFQCPVGKVFVVHKIEWRGVEYILKNRTISPNRTITNITASTNNVSMVLQTNTAGGSLAISPTSVLPVETTSSTNSSGVAPLPGSSSSSLQVSPGPMPASSSSSLGASSSVSTAPGSSPSSSSVIVSPASIPASSSSPISASLGAPYSSSSLEVSPAPISGSLGAASSSRSSTSLGASVGSSNASESASLEVASTASASESVQASVSASALPAPASTASLSSAMAIPAPVSTSSAASASLSLAALPSSSSSPPLLTPHATVSSSQNGTIVSSLMASSSFHIEAASINASLSSLNSSVVPKQNSTVRYEYYNITEELNPKRIFAFRLQGCRGKRKCNFNVTKQRLGDPYKDKITSLQFHIKHSCQYASNGYLQWLSWSACPDVCGVTYHQVRRRICANPTTTTGGGDCSGLKSETRTTGCYTGCLDYHSTTCDFMTANLTCPNNTFINIQTIFYGQDQEINNTCNIIGPINASCIPSNDMAGHNNAQVYERCQMRRNCTFVVSNETFKDPCLGLTKYLKIDYTCSPVFKRTFCDDDQALVSCPYGMRVVFHGTPFYGQMNTSEACPSTGGLTCQADTMTSKYNGIEDYCGAEKCDIPAVSSQALGLKQQCKDSSNYLSLYQSCQKHESVYTAWAPWRDCEACGLTSQLRRFRDCIKPNPPYDVYDPMWACSWGSKYQAKHCYYACADRNITLNDGENTTIICPKFSLYDDYYTVIEIRSVFYGNDSCPSNNGSKIVVVKRCQGRHQCFLEASTDIFNDPCPGINKYLHVTYRCQTIFRMHQYEGYSLVPRDLRCYDDMVIVTHKVLWQIGECPDDLSAFKVIQSLCDGRNSCDVRHTSAVLGSPCPSKRYFTMYYSCQTAYGGLDSEWSAWSNCTECGHTPVKTRVKACLNPVTQTSGAHCPLFQQIAPCNFPCPVTGLSFTNNSFSLVLGQNLSVHWSLSLGTNSTVVIDWGDNTGNETVAQNIMANATTPFSLINEHNYTSEGDYDVKIYAFNFFSNQTIWKTAHVQVELSGLNFTAPSAVVTNATSRFNISLDVTSLSAPNVSFLFGDGSTFSSTSFETNYSYPRAGVFLAKVIATNKVSTLSSSSQVIVQDTVLGFKVDRSVYLVAVGTTARFLFSITQGTNVSVNAIFDDCQLPSLSTWLSGPDQLNSLLTCDFDTVTVCNVLFYASNAISQANTSAVIISEVAIQGFNVTVECQTKYPSCFQHDQILFNLSLANGTLPTFVFNMADGHIVTLSNTTFAYSYTTHGTFDVNITAYNNVSSMSFLRNITIAELSPIAGVHLTCNKTVGLSNITVCHFGVQQGTAFQCWLNLDDEMQREVFFMYFNLTSSLSFNYTQYGAYTVKFSCNNSISSGNAEFVTKVVPRNLQLSINHSGPVMVKRNLTLTLTASETGYPTCLMLDLGNNHSVIFGTMNCTPVDGGSYTVIPSFTYPSVQYSYSYISSGVYNLTWSGQNDFNSLAVKSTVVVTDLPCSAPTVTLQNIASNPLSPTGVTRSKEVIIRSSYQIHCERATGATLRWKIFKNETGQGFDLHTTKITETSNFILPPKELEYGTYRIKLTLTLRNAYDIMGTAEGYLKVTSSDLIVDIQEGSANIRMYSQPVFINATGSKDPDTSDVSGLEFTWYCYNITDRFADFDSSETPLSTLQDVLGETPLPEGCFSQNGTLEMNSSEITLPKERMVKSGVYVVKLVLKVSNREATKSTVIQMTDKEITHFHISCKVNCKHLVITTDILSVSSHCISGACPKVNSTSSFSWELFYRKVNDTGAQTWTKVDDLEVMALSNTSSSNLVLKPNVLKPEMVYVMRLWHRSFAHEGHEGLTEYSFITSRAPHGGNCSVSPLAGEGYKTMFTFRCSGWQTKHLPLLYVLSYFDPYTQLKPMLFRSEAEQFPVRKLAPGDPNGKNFTLKIFFSVVDSLGARIDEERLIKVVPREIVQSELDDLVLNQNSKLDFYLNIGDIDSVSELVSGVISNLNYEATNNDSSVSDRQKEVRYIVIEKISRIPISTLKDVNQVATMIAAATEAKKYVNSTSQRIATDKISSGITLLFNKSQADVGVSEITEGAVNLVSAVFNVLMSASYNADFKRKDDTNSADQEKSKDIANENMEAFDRVADAVFNKLLPGQKDIEIRTKSAIMTCRRARSDSIVNHPIVAGDASVTFPDIQDLLGFKAVDVQVVFIPSNPFSWDKSSELVTTSILDVKIKEAQGARRVVNISNLEEEIDLQIPFDPLTPASAPGVFFKQSDNESIQYHTFEVDNTNQAIEFNVKPMEETEQLTILVKYGKKPTLSEHDLQVKLPNFSSCALPVKFPFEDDNCTENPYSIFLSSTYLSNVGTYYIGVKYEESSGNQSDTHSRKRRDCGGGGRSKRSLDCIEYKEPPPTQPSNGKFGQGKQSYDKSKHSNYTMESLGLGCNFWSPSGNQFSGGGCRTGRRRTLSRTMSCRCKHLTSFGGGLLVKPNPIDFDKVWIAFDDIHNNMAVLATMISIFLIYLLVIIWARRADIRDRDSQEGTVAIGKSGNNYAYKVTIATSKGRNSGTTAKVAFIVVGENGTSGVIPLSTLTKIKFNRGSVVTCTLYLPGSLGQLLYLHIWHDNGGESPSWSLDHVVIQDTLSDEKWKFMCGEWLAVESGNGQTEKVIYVSNIDEITNYKHLFLSNSADGLYDEHLWISIAAKPPQSTFSRVQRTSCCLSILFSTMIANAMFYDSGSVDKSPVFYLGPIKISMRQLMIGIQSSLIIFPINLAITQLFRKSSNASTSEADEKTDSPPKTEPSFFRRRFGRRSSSQKYYPMSYQTKSTSSLSTIASTPDSGFNLKPGIIKKSIDKRKLLLYRCMYYLAWILCFVSVFVSAFFTLLYSLQWGSERSQQWLLSFFVSFIQDAAISQPVKVALFSALLAFILKFSMEQKEKHRIRTQRKTGRDVNTGFTRSTEVQLDDNISCDDTLPLQKNALEKAKLKRMKELKSSEVMTDVLFYSVFLLLLLMVAYGHRDPIAYQMTKHLENKFSLSVSHYSFIYSWVLYVFIPTIFVGPRYNGMAAAASENGLLNDRSSAVVGMARLRQLRILNDSCSTIPFIRYFSRGCYGPYTFEDEDKNIYQPEWVPAPFNIPAANISHDVCPRPWRYQTAADLKGVPLWGTTTVYSGGGYVAELGYYPAKAKQVITELAHHKWVDRRSRGVFVELTVYNAQVNLFSVISLLMEASPTGGVVTFRRIDTIRVYRYVGELANVALAAELIICLVILFLLYKVIKRMYHQRMEFFKKFWNLVDLLQVLFALVSIALYFVNMVSINATMKDLSDNPFVFVSFSLLLTWNEIDTYMIAFVIFLTTLKFLYLLRYNSYIKLLNQTFSNMREEILLFMVQFLFWFIPFVIMAHITFGAHLEDFITLPTAFQAMLNALLGASYFHDLEEVDRVIGPALFFTYSILMELILLNMFVSIINSAFESRECELDNAEIEPELVEFIMKRLKAILGANLLSSTVSPESHEKWYVDDSSDEENDHRISYTNNHSMNLLHRKIESLQSKFRKFSILEEEEDEAVLLEMMLIKREHESLPSSQSECSVTTESSF